MATTPTTGEASAPASTEGQHGAPLEARIAIGVAVGFALFHVAERLVVYLLQPLADIDSGDGLAGWTIQVGNGTLRPGEALVAATVLAVTVGLAVVVRRLATRR